MMPRIRYGDSSKEKKRLQRELDNVDAGIIGRQRIINFFPPASKRRLDRVRWSGIERTGMAISYAPGAQDQGMMRRAKEFDPKSNWTNNS
jgi:hypothetical protein